MPADLSPLRAEVEGPIASAGETVTLRVRVANHGETDAAGDVRVTGPEGWSLTPGDARPSDLLAPGESATVAFSVTVPAGAAPGSLPGPRRHQPRAQALCRRREP